MKTSPAAKRGRATRAPARTTMTQAQGQVNENTHFYTVASVAGPSNAVTASAASAKGTKVVVVPASTSNAAMKTQVVPSSNAGVVTTLIQIPSSSSSGGATTIEVPADTLQLIASSLPSSNLVVNYPHTMWEKNADGSAIPIQIIKQELSGHNDAGQQVTVVHVDGTKSKHQQVIVADGDGLDRPHRCDICQKGFAKREHLTKHVRIHKSDNKRYACDFCQKAFRDRYELVRHTKRHVEDFPYRCNDCDKGFMRHERYLTHLRWHSGERPYQCTMCEKAFRDKNELNRHSRRHTGDLPYKCETCSKGFLRHERYVTHVRIHTGEKPFVCPVCSRGYRDRRELKKHQATHNHTVESPTSNSVTQAKTIIVGQSVSLPNQPVPREKLSLQGGNAVQVIDTAPLNPATIPLPPSVASALQSINEKVAARQAAQANAVQVKLSQGQHQAIAVKHEQQYEPQVVAISTGGSPTLASSSGGPLFYYIMPNGVGPFNIVTEGATLQST